MVCSLYCEQLYMKLEPVGNFDPSFWTPSTTFADPRLGTSGVDNKEALITTLLQLFIANKNMTPPHT